MPTPNMTHAAIHHNRAIIWNAHIACNQDGSYILMPSYIDVATHPPNSLGLKLKLKFELKIDWSEI